MMPRCSSSRLVLRPVVILLATLLAFVVSAPARAADASSSRISYDGQCLTIDGRDVQIFSGSFHYVRCPKELWRERFAKIVEAGLNCVELYVPWNYHERQMPRDVDDFSKVDLTDLRDFLHMAHEEFGLYTIVRPGPYICAEWTGGGFPAWLLTKRPKDVPENRAWLRTDDPVYLAWARHWYDAVCPVVAAEQVTRKEPGKGPRGRGRGGTILFQIENEYDLFREPTESQRMNHLRALHKWARADGIDVPMMTCWTKQCRNSSDPELKDVFDGPNFYPRWQMAAVIERLRAVRAEQPNAPVMVPEMQGGWFSQVGGKLSEDQEGIDAAQIHHLTLLSLAEGATITNYYMMFGGTNFGDWEGRTDTTTYDYNAPIREPGGVGDRYLAVKAIGLMLREHGAELARAKQVKAEVSDADKAVEFLVRRAAKGATYVFCRNTVTEAKRGTAHVKIGDEKPLVIDYDLSPRGFKVLYLKAGSTEGASGEWLPKPVEAPVRPKVPDAVRITKALKRADDAPDSSAEWTTIADGESLIAHGIYDSRFVPYRADVQLDAEQVKTLSALWLDMFQDDAAVLSVNGKLAQAHGTYRGRPVFPLKGLLKGGDNHIVALFENKGRPNFGRGIEALTGIRGGVLARADQLGVPVATWRAKLVESSDADASSLVADDVNDQGWPQFTLDDAMAERLSQTLQPGSETKQDEAARILFGHKARAVYRSTVELTDADIQAGRTRLTFDRIGGGSTMFVNGHEAGRGRPTSGDRPLTINASKLLRPGVNHIAVVVDNPRGGPGGLLAPVYLAGEQVQGLPLHWQIASNLPGVAQGWWREDFTDTSGWQSIDLDAQRPIERKGNASTTPNAPAESIATWYRMVFELPSPDKNVWIPWRAVLDASGDGYVYLNGHNLGRYWEIGPQREFYLPECWLKFGAGQKNVLTVLLRSTDRGSMLRAAEVAPYAEQAELRNQSQ